MGLYMKRRTQFLLFLLSACILQTAFLGNVSGSAGKTVIITPAITGNSVSLNVGDILEIQIPTIPVDGFEWVVQDLDTAILNQEGSAVYAADTSPNSAGGVATLKFKAVNAGTTTLNLLYASLSSGEMPGLSADSFGMMVEVK